MTKTSLKRWLVLLSVGALVSSAGCGGCTDTPIENNSTSACPDGQVEHPITGECEEPDRTNAFMPPVNNTPMSDMGPSDMGDMDAMDMERPPPPDMPVVMVDLGEDDRCAPGIDSDGDGLDNDCECNFEPSPLDPGNSDTDGDGLPDGYEDANMDCKTTGAETQPTVADTDSDGIDDGTEVNTPGLNPLRIDSDDDGIGDGVEFGSCLDPTNPDTDGDGIEDGIEDANGDGQIGVCPNRMYEPGCAQGEYDPCSNDTDGDGEPDDQEVNFLGCRDEFLQAIPAPTILTNNGADYQIAISQNAQGAPVMALDAHAYNHASASYAGFVASLNRPSGAIEILRDQVLAGVQSKYGGARLVSNGRRTISHDNYDAIVSIKIDLGVSGRPDTARDEVLAGVSGTNTINHGLTGSFSNSAGNLSLIVGIIDRGAGKYIVTAAVAPDAIYENITSETGYLVDDTTSAMSVAKSGEMFENACVAYRVDDRPKVDFIWIIDGSGSMSDENALVEAYASDFAQVLGQSNLDWRLGVVTSHCDGITNDPAVSPEVAALIGGDGGLMGPCPSFDNFPGFPGGGGGLKNGQLCDPGFTTDPAAFANCISQASSQAIVTEYTVTIAPAAIDRALPRQANNAYKLRENAATVIISVTDEFDDFIQGEMGWRDAGGQGDTPNDLSTGINYTQLDMVVQPFIDYLRQPESNATAFGIYWIPGQPCAGASETAAGIDSVVNATGGTAGNICDGTLQNTLSQIAQASAGLASGLRLRGIPLPSTLKVRQGDVSTQMIVEPPRSRQQGWDYDAVTNAVSFKGNTPPETNDRVIITYKRWVNSIQGCQIDADCNNGFQKFQCRDGICI